MNSFKKHPLDFKTQYGLGFDPIDDEIVVDFFCGGGGAGTGLEIGLGRAVTVAKNHNPAAISMHTPNHPAAQHQAGAGGADAVGRDRGTGRGADVDDSSSTPYRA